MVKIKEQYFQLVSEGKLSADPAQIAALDEFERIENAISQASQTKKRWFRSNVPTVRGLYLWGGVGRGKSALMDLFCKTAGVSVRREHFHAFMQEIHQQMHQARKSKTQDALLPIVKSIANEARILALDEMQITDITDAMIVGRLFKALTDEGVTIVTTSNRPPDDLYKNGLNRQLFLPFIEFIKANSVVYELKSSKDYRLGRLQDQQVYYTPLSAETQIVIDQMWRDLTEGNSTLLELSVNGRIVEFSNYCDGMLKTTFDKLCGQALGPADYLELANNVQLLIVTDIPLLGRNNFNEAKRFVTLIDTLYEKRSKLICSAAANPEDLYVKGEGAFEFERTVSRLHEMQSQDWWQ